MKSLTLYSTVADVQSLYTKTHVASVTLSCYYYEFNTKNIRRVNLQLISNVVAAAFLELTSAVQKMTLGKQ